MIPDRFDAPFKISRCLGALELRGWGPIDPRQMISRVLFIHRDSLSNSSDFMFLHLLRGDLDWQQMRVSYGAPGSMLEQEWIGLHFPYLGWHNDPPVGVKKKRLADWIGTFNVDTISEEILDRYSYTPVREFQATGCEDWCKENSRRHVSNILSNEPYFVSKGLVVPHVISVHYSHDMPLVLWYTLYSPYYHRVSHWFC